METGYYKSKYTLLLEGGLLVNYLTGSMDQLDAEEAADLQKRFASGNWDAYGQVGYLLERGYLFKDQAEEDDWIQRKFLEFQDEYDKTPVQIIFSPTYSCNLACVYCFQEEYNNGTGRLTAEVTDAFFRYVDRQFIGEVVKPYITLFGGEPLMAGDKYQQNLLYFLEQARDGDYEITIVTNGYELSDWLPLIKERNIRIKEIQVSLDGNPVLHDRRRIKKDGGPTFAKITDGIDQALKMGYRINLRPIVDKRNMDGLPALAEYCQSRGWLDYPTQQFETTLGRNYELHSCQNVEALYTRVEMWQEYAALAKENPILKKFHFPQFHGMRYLKENGNLPFPVFDSCPAGKKEWAYDAGGGIYGCTASVGVEKYRLGNFLTGEITDAAQVDEWQSRDVLAMDSCRDCPVSLSCGGGCGVLAANKSGEILSPDCRPVSELVKIGVEYYGLVENTNQPKEQVEVP